VAEHLIAAIAGLIDAVGTDKNNIARPTGGGGVILKNKVVIYPEYQPCAAELRKGLGRGMKCHRRFMACPNPFELESPGIDLQKKHCRKAAGFRAVAGNITVDNLEKLRRTLVIAHRCSEKSPD